MALLATSKLTCAKSVHPHVQLVQPPWTPARAANKTPNWSGSLKRHVSLRAQPNSQWQSATSASHVTIHAQSVLARLRLALFAKITWSSIKLRTLALRSAKKKLRSTTPTVMMGRSTANNAIKSARSAVVTSTDALSAKMDTILTSLTSTKTLAKTDA